MMPNYDLGDRQLGVLPEVRSPQIRWGEIGRDIGETGRTVAHGIDRINEAQYRNRLRAQREAEYAAKLQKAADEREAEYRAAQGVDWYKIRWNGQDVQDPKTGKWTHVNGVVDRTWQEFDRDKTTALDEMNRLKREFRETEIYTSMTPNQRKAFDRVWAFKENEFQRAAQVKHFELGKRKIEDERKKLDFNDDTSVIQVEGQDTGIFNATAEHAAARKLYRMYGTSVKSDLDYNDPRFNLGFIRFVTENNTPEGVDPRYSTMKKEYDAILQEYKKNRITNLLRTAETDSPNATSLFAKAQETIWSLEGKNSKGEKILEVIGKDKEGKPITREKSGTITEDQASALSSLIRDAQKNRQKVRASKVKEELSEAIHKVRDTNVLIDGKTLLEKKDYNAYIDAMVADKALTREAAEEFKDTYGELIKHRDFVKKSIENGNGVWIEAEGADGKKTTVFQPFVPGSGREKIDAFYEDKYRKVARPGEKSIWDNPATAINELDIDYNLGRISTQFYNAEMKKARVIQNEKAVAAFVKVFGFDPKVDEFIPTEYRKKITATPRRASVWAKNTAWAGNITRNYGRGEEGLADWQNDLLVEDGGESLVTDEQRIQIFDFCLLAASTGYDPEEALRNVLAPTLKKWQQSELSERLNSTVEKDAKNFMNWMLGKGLLNENGTRTLLDPASRDNRVRQGAFNQLNKGDKTYSELNPKKDNNNER